MHEHHDVSLDVEVSKSVTYLMPTVENKVEPGARLEAEHITR